MAGEYLYAVSYFDTMYNRKISSDFLPSCLQRFPCPFFGGKFRPKIANLTRHDLRERNLVRACLTFRSCDFLLWKILMVRPVFVLSKI